LCCEIILFCALALINTKDIPTPSIAMSDNSTIVCGGVEQIEDYDLNLHIAGLFIVLGVSAIGVLGAIWLTSSKVGQRNKKLLFAIQVLKFFGIGVIVSTAWIHILPDAFSAFSDPCLLQIGDWAVYGINYVGLFGMLAGFLVQGIEFGVIARHDAMRRRLGKNEKTDVDPANCQDSRLNPDEPPSETQDLKHKSHEHHAGGLHDIAGHAHGVAHAVTSEDAAAKDIGTLILEVGIMVHSVLIGIELGVTSGNDYISLLIAICFHQLFEGMALGVRIAELKHVKNLASRLGIGCAYPITTPIGIAIGIGVHFSYEPSSPIALVSQAIVDSLAAGILIYNSYVELIAMEMNQSQSFRAQKPAKQFACFLSLYLGAAAMAVLAIWA
jgi:ZIP zinc/iron transport family